MSRLVHNTSNNGFGDEGAEWANIHFLESNGLWHNYEDFQSKRYTVESRYEHEGKRKVVRMLLSYLTNWEILQVADYLANPNPKRLDGDNRYRLVASRIVKDKMNAIEGYNDVHFTNSQRNCLMAFIRPAILEMP